MCPTKLIDVEFDDDMPSVIPGYKALCANISTRQVPTTAIGYMPFLPLPPTSETVVAEALKKNQQEVRSKVFNCVTGSCRL